MDSFLRFCVSSSPDGSCASDEGGHASDAATRERKTARTAQCIVRKYRWKLGGLPAAARVAQQAPVLRIGTQAAQDGGGQIARRARHRQCAVESAHCRLTRLPLGERVIEERDQD